MSRISFSTASLSPAIVRVCAVFAAATLLQACVSVRTNHGYVLERDQTQLDGEAGFDTKESILAKFGEPSLVGAFDADAWYYLHSSDTARAFFRPKTRARNVVAFYFDDEGVVENVQKLNIEDGENIKMVSRTTPTRGKELNFWEQLLGNVGQLPAGLGQEGQTPGQ